MQRKPYSPQQSRKFAFSLKEKSAYNKRPEPEEAIWHEAKTMKLFTERYGGSLKTVMDNFQKIKLSHSTFFSSALTEIADFNIQCGNVKQAITDYTVASSSGEYPALAKLALLYLQQNDIARSLQCIEKLSQTRPSNLQIDFNILTQEKNTIASILFYIARIFFALGKTFDLGFKKAQTAIPNTAYEIAAMLWKTYPSPKVMDLMLACLAPCYLQGELLPLMISGIQQGILTHRQILKTAEIAMENYELETANTILTDLKQCS